MWLAWIAAAHAAEFDPNVEPQLFVSLVHHNGADHRWGVEAGAGLLAALGDNCDWFEDECQRSAWWPVVGVRPTVGWRGAGRFSVGVEALAGGGVLDAYQFGFFPIGAAFGHVGVLAEVSEPLALTLGATAVKSLSYTDIVSRTASGGRSYRTYGFAPLALEAGFRGRLGPHGWLPARWRVGLGLHLR